MIPGAILQTALHVGGAIFSGIQAYQANQKAKEASRAAEQFASQFASIQEENAFSGLKVPDISSLAFDRNAQTQAQTIEALRGSGAEGAGMVTAVNKQASDTNVGIAEDQAKLMYQRDMTEAQAQQQINQGKAQREADLSSWRMIGAQQASADQAGIKNQAIANAFTGVGNAISSLSSYEGVKNSNSNIGTNTLEGQNL